MPLTSSPKITTREAAAKRCQELRASGKVVGFTSGAFDIFHAGHATYLAQARSNCDFLIVALNSDQSIRSYKSQKRPIILQDDRALVLAALTCVDLVFIFDENNNNENVRIIKPSLYIKAKDYSNKPLSSAPIIEQQGGKVLLMEIKEGLSTSAIIDTVVARYGSEAPRAAEKIPSERKPAVFLDRDGTVIEHVEFLSESERVKVLPTAAQAIRLMREKGYWVILTTNQPGIGLGYFTKEQFFVTNRAMLKALSAEKAALDKIYYSPHTQGDGTDFNKPGLGMIRRACAELPIDLNLSVVIGDSTVDLQFAANAGLKSILVQSGNAGTDGRYAAVPTFTASTLLAAAESLPQVSSAPVIHEKNRSN